MSNTVQNARPLLQHPTKKQVVELQHPVLRSDSQHLPSKIIGCICRSASIQCPSWTGSRLQDYVVIIHDVDTLSQSLSLCILGLMQRRFENSKLLSCSNRYETEELKLRHSKALELSFPENTLMKEFYVQHPEVGHFVRKGGLVCQLQIALDILLRSRTQFKIIPPSQMGFSSSTICHELLFWVQI